MAFTTQARLRAVERELVDREPVFHRPLCGTTRAELEATTDPDFFEVGASGRLYDRAFVLDTVARRWADGEPGDDLRGRDFHCRELAPDLYQLSYTLSQGDRDTRRTSLWRRVDGRWRILHHQGTVISG
jgi:hypothetical protein